MADRAKGHTVILLDPKGKSCTSEVFSVDLYRWLDVGGSRVAFVIGGADGLPLELKMHVDRKESSKVPFLPSISLSALTFTHQFARVLLVEQCYRAAEIRKGKNLMFRPCRLLYLLGCVFSVEH